MAIVAAALGAVVLLAALADGRLLVADPDPSAVTAADVRLARSLFPDVAPPAALAEACIAGDGAIDPSCLDEGAPGSGPATVAEVVPRDCRDEGSISAACVERELGIDVPPACVQPGGALDVGCLAGRGSLLVLTDRCLDDGWLRQECLEGRVFGVPDPGPGDDEPWPRADPVLDERTGPVVPSPNAEERERRQEEPDGRTGLDALLDRLTQGLGVVLLAGLVLGLVVGVVLAVRRRRTAPPVPVAPAGDDDAHDRAVMAASLDASAHQLDLSGDPRAVIIAAYAMLLEGLAACAQERHPAETPLEHLERVLAALDVRPEPLRDLTTLFGEARFSDHPMTTRHVERARAALAAAAADLDRVREAVG